MILLIDNYDSFAHNLARYVRQLGPEVVVVRNDQLDVLSIGEINPEALIFSPGPCTPDLAGISLEAVRQWHQSLPMLGVCLGHQAICQALGGTIARNPPMHGRTSRVFHSGHPLFQGIPSPFFAGRYHSLVCKPDRLPDCLEPIATAAEDGVVMAVAHRQRPIFGVQFHPESVMTACGYRLLANFLGLAGIGYNADPDELQRGCLATAAAPAETTSGEEPSGNWPPIRL